MARYVIDRLIGLFVSLFVAAVLVGLLVDFIPGDPVKLMYGTEDSSGELIIDKRRHELGLDRPVHVRLVEWIANAVRGDFGRSFFLSESVAEIIARRYPVTMALTVLSLFIAVSVGVPAGIIASVKQGRPADWIAMFLSVLVLSIPSFWLGPNLILLFSIKLGWLPSASFLRSYTENLVVSLKYLLLPSLALGLGSAGIIARFTRTSMLEVLREDYVTVARAKGLKEHRVLLGHALRNALVPILTVVGIITGGLIGGSVIIESVFTIPGIGRMVVEAVKRRDYPVIQAGVLLVTASYLVLNLVVDLLYGWLDPRIRYK